MNHNEIVAYTTDGKPLTKQELNEILINASNEAHAGIDLISHEEVFAKFEAKIKEYEHKKLKHNENHK